MNSLLSNQITLVIPTLSNTKGLKRLVSELLVSGVKIVVVDNNPDEEKRELAAAENCTYLPQKENLGFAAGVNLGAKQVTTDWMIIANDDVEGVDENLILNLLESAEKENWDAVSPILKNSQGKIENIGYKVLPIGRVELNFDPQKNSSKQLDGLTAAFLLIKKKVFDSVGGFDESFFAYLEDVDLFLTLKERGYSFGVDTSVAVLHNHLTTSSKTRGFKQKQDIKNWWKLYSKHFTITLSASFLIERGRNIAGWVKYYLDK
jgi:GT2 family glycosyltransferase